jgi:hypothetical protein
MALLHYQPVPINLGLLRHWKTELLPKVTLFLLIFTGRLFGSLRADNSFVNNLNQQSASMSSTIPSIDQTKLLDALPFRLDLSVLSFQNKNALEQIMVYISRAYSISSLADQFWDDLQNCPAQSPNHDNLSMETLNLLVFAVGLYQYAMNHAKDLWGAGPSITKTGYSFSSSPPDTQPVYLSHLSTLISFIQTQFNMYLDRAEHIPTPTVKAKSAQRIVFETALNTCKRGAMAELGNQSGSPQGYYKTSVLLLKALLQPPWDPSVENLAEEDKRDIQQLLDQLSIRLYRLGL